MLWWIYRDSANDSTDGGIFIHEASCSNCNNGRGNQPNPAPQISPSRYHGEKFAWIGPFNSHKDAEDFGDQNWGRWKPHNCK